MKKNLSFLSLFLAFVMVLSLFTACTSIQEQNDATSSSSSENLTEDTNNVSDETTLEPSEPTSVESSGDVSEETAESSVSEDASSTTEGSADSSNTENSETASSESASEDTVEGLLADVENGELIEHADKLANGVQAYFSDASRDKFVVENRNMTLEYLTDAFDDQYVSAIKNKDGFSYIENTMDIFVRMKDGSTFYAADSLKNTTMNIYRLGYYYYHVLLQGQDFASGGVISERVGLSTTPTTYYQIKTLNNNDNSFGFKVANEQDPRVIFEGFEHSTDAYNAVQIKIKAKVADTRKWELFIKTSEVASYTYDAYTQFLVTPSEDYYLYTVKLDAINGFDGNLIGLRLDPGGLRNEEYAIESIELVHIEDGGAANLYLNRSFHVYSDKLHHVAQISAKQETENIDVVGMVTKIKADTVSHVMAFDANGIHNSFDGVDWSSVEYFAFDITDAGIFGFVLPYGETDSFSVTLEDGVYTIIQSRTPDGNKIVPSEVGTSNANDFYLGQRIYTDATHSFDGFIYEAACERNPLIDKNIKVKESTSDRSSFVGYDSLRGIYVVSIAGTGFNNAYFGEWNKHYRSEITIRCDEPRNIYLMTASTSGSLECAVLLDQNDMLLPVPIEVTKNFYGDGEDNIYNLDDSNYSEAIFPLVIQPEVKYTYNVINLYQNWGQYPLKQISSIQFHEPYYHLSTGVTESNCIMPWVVSGPCLPDHRAASAPLWPTQPQHTSGGSHRFLAYTNADGVAVGSENIQCTIDSYGPTYADVVLDYITADGKIKVSYTHMEFPQLDENRGYYEMKYEVLEDVSFNDFKNDFKLFSMATNNKTGKYNSLGYLDENNVEQTVLANTSSEKVSYILGDDCPYFDYFELLDYTDSDGNGYVNISFLIYNYDFDLEGFEGDPDFIINDFENTVSLSLNLDEFTLKAGDSFTINSIIMPWGSQETVYDGSNGKAPDQNVRDVRNNTLKSPLTVTALNDSEIIDSPYLPRIKSTNGKSAEFTLSGGHENVAVRVYGFDKLTAPKFYELIDGEWVEFLVSSYAKKEYDYMGNAHYYDGYMVYYDGDGTFSYSFVTTMGHGAARTFKIVADEDFDGWEKVPEKVAYNPMNVYYDAVEFYQMTGSNTHFSDIALSADTSYISFFSTDRISESYIQMFANKENVTGKYIVLKYRLPESNEKKISVVEFFTSTTNSSINGADSLYLSNSIIADGEWHVLIVDLEACSKGAFAADADGNYIARYLRFDVFNYNLPTGIRFDVAYLGIHDDLDEIREVNSDMETLTIAMSKADTYYMDQATGDIGGKIEIVKNPTVTPSDPEVDEDTTPTIVRFDNEKMASKAIVQPGFSNVEVSDDGEYVAFYAKDGASEANFHVFTGGKDATGRYVVLKYRLPSTNEAEVTTLEFYISSTNSSAAAADSVYYQKCLINDGEWHVAIFDIVSHGGAESYTLNDKEQYVASYLRVDIFNTKLPEGTEFDVAYLGMTNSLDCIFEEFSEFESFTLSTSEGKTETIDKSYKAAE